MLLSTVEDIHKHYPVPGSLNFEDIKPFIRIVEARDVVDILSSTEYKNLQTAYDNSIAPTPTPLSPKQESLLELCRDIIIPLAILELLPTNYAKVAASGLKVQDGENSRSAYRWEKDFVVEDLPEKSNKAVEAIYRFLEDNQDTFTDWAGSDSATLYKGSIIRDTKQFEAAGPQIDGSRRAFLKLRPFIRDLQETKAINYLGAGLLADIISNLGAPSDTYKLILNMLRPAIAYEALANAVDVISFRFTSKGLVLYEATSGAEDPKFRQASDNEIAKKKIVYMTTAETKWKLLSSYLDANADSISLYKNSTAYQPDNPKYLENSDDWGVVGMM